MNGRPFDKLRANAKTIIATDNQKALELNIGGER